MRSELSARISKGAVNKSLQKASFLPAPRRSSSLPGKMSSASSWTFLRRMSQRYCSRSKGSEGECTYSETNASRPPDSPAVFQSLHDNGCPSIPTRGSTTLSCRKLLPRSGSSCTDHSHRAQSVPVDPSCHDMVKRSGILNLRVPSHP
jgi:hypothetical protein